MRAAQATRRRCGARPREAAGGPWSPRTGQEQAGSQVKEIGIVVPDYPVTSLLPAVQWRAGMGGIAGTEAVLTIIHLEVMTCSYGRDSVLDAYETFVLSLYYVWYFYFFRCQLIA